MKIGGRKTLIAAILGLGVILGAVAVISTVAVNTYTSTTEFCSSCHSMTFVAQDSNFLASAHISNEKGVIVSCGDCHIPAGNIFVETYTHASQGLKDIIAEQTNDFSDPEIWEARRIELAHQVRDEMRLQDSVTCRSCHDPQKIEPRSTAGKAAHDLLQSQNVTCIDCHLNLVHAPVTPRMSFIRGSGLGTQVVKEK